MIRSISSRHRQTDTRGSRLCFNPSVKEEGTFASQRLFSHMMFQKNVEVFSGANKGGDFADPKKKIVYFYL